MTNQTFETSEVLAVSPLLRNATLLSALAVVIFAPRFVTDVWTGLGPQERWTYAIATVVGLCAAACATIAAGLDRPILLAIAAAFAAVAPTGFSMIGSLLMGVVAIWAVGGALTTRLERVPHVAAEVQAVQRTVPVQWMSLNDGVLYRQLEEPVAH